MTQELLRTDESLLIHKFPQEYLFYFAEDDKLCFKISKHSFICESEHSDHLQIDH